MGEQSHGDGTCFETKTRLVKFLHQEMGFDVLVFESGLYDCNRAWKAFENTETPAVAAKAGVFGIWSGSQQTQDLWKYLADRANSDSPLELAGFDCQFTGRASVEHLIGDLKKLVVTNNLDSKLTDQESFYSQLDKLIDGKQGDLKVLSEGLSHLVASIESCLELTPSDLKKSDLEFWKQNLISIAELADYQWSGEDQGMKGPLYRDLQMAKNLLWLKKEVFPKRKIIVWAASFHIMRNPSGIKVPNRSFNYNGMVQMGHAVHEALGSKVFTVGFTAAEGKAGAFFRPAIALDPPPQGTLEDIFVRADIEHGLLPLKSDEPGGNWLNDKRFSRPLGYSWMQAQWNEHFDAMVFNRVMEPSKPAK